MLEMNPLTLLRLLGQPDFQVGLGAGLVSLVLLFLVRQSGWLIVWGVAAAVALALTGWLRGNPMTPDWGLTAVALTAIGSAASFRILLRHVPAWSIGIVFSLWVLGVWGTVPDTERAVVVMGTTTGMLPALWPSFRIRLGWEGAAVAVAVLGFVAISDGPARFNSIVGSLGMVGMPMVAAGACLLVNGGRWLSPWWLIAAQVVHVIVSGRIAGQSFQTGVALTLVVLSALVSGGGIAFGSPLLGLQTRSAR